MYEFYYIISLLFIVVSLSIYLACEKSLVKCVVALNMISFLVSGVYLIMNAPDVAMTEAAVGAGLSTLIILKAINRVSSKYDEAPIGFFTLVLMLLMFVLVGYLTFEFPLFGSEYVPVHGELTQFFISNSYEQLPNVVSMILAGFRAYDTLGETLVVFIAAASVFSIIRNDSRKDPNL